LAILISGGASYIGGHIVRQFGECGEEVIVLDKLSTGSVDALIHGELLVVADLADAQAMQRVFKRTPSMHSCLRRLDCSV
jgi:UDP-glucose 4-epimerase